MTDAWPKIMADLQDETVAPDRFRSRHGGIAGIARSADGLILMLTAVLAPLLLGVSNPQSARELVVAALGAGVVFALYDTGSRYLLESGMSATRLPFRTCLPSFILACTALPFILVLLGTTLAIAVLDDAAWAGVSLPALLIWRRILDQVLAHERVVTRLSRRLVMVGDGDATARMTRRLSMDPMIKVVMVIDETDSSFSWDDLDRIVRETGKIEGVVLLLPYEHRTEIRAVLIKLRRLHADLYVDPALVADDPLQPLVRIGGSTLAVVQRRPLTVVQSFQKGLFDRIFGLLLLLPILPLMLGLMLLVRLESPGPSLFRQPRIGLHGRRFEILKLRTMRSDQSDLLADRQTRLGDPRVTRAGRWLRKFSLDELPQLFNVVRGDMSLVGPRPHALNTRASGKLLDDALAEYVIRHQVKPGITGWAQVNGARGQLETIDQLRRRVELDLEYMQRWSLMLDLRILLLTLYREVFSKHAY